MSGACGGASCGGCACSGKNSKAGRLVVRSIRPQDVERCRALFAAGIKENGEWSHLPISRFAPVTLAGIAAAATGLATRGAGSRVVLGVLGLGAALAAACAGLSARVQAAMEEYVQEHLAGDMADPVAFYSRPGSNFFVAEVDGEVVGTVALEQKSAQVAELRRMSVARQARGRGVARALWRALVAFAREQKYERIVLGTTSLMLDAVPMYQRWGFRLTKEWGVGLGPIIRIRQYELPLADARGL
eukprot:tig00001490_g8966.t1